jgi:hypothetical protein
MDEIWVSPNFKSSKLDGGTIDDKIDVFEDQLKGWTLNHAFFLTDPSNPSGNQNAGYAILMLSSAYFETVESCYQGRTSGYGESKRFFRAGFLRVFPDLPDKAKGVVVGVLDDEVRNLVDALYDEVRCGLYHRLATKSRVLLSRTKMPVTFVLKEAVLSAMVVDPWALLEAVAGHLTVFVGELRNRNNTAVRASFESFFSNKRAGIPATVPPGFFAPAKSTYP